MSAQDPPPLTESATLEDGTRVLSIRIHAGRKPFDEQHTVTAPDGESRVFETPGETQTIRDGKTGDVLSRTTFTPTGLVAEPVAARVKALGGHTSAAILGTRIHAEIASIINSQNDPNFVAEIILADRKQKGSFIILGSRRADIFEDLPPTTACVYDTKTGRQGLAPARVAILIKEAHRLYPHVKRFIFIQVRPRR